MRDLYRPIIEQSFGNLPVSLPGGQLKRVELIITTPVNAEMIKYAANAFLATKISFINEIANICEQVGSDVTVISGNRPGLQDWPGVFNCRHRLGRELFW